MTGHADMRVVDKIIGLALAAAGITLDGAAPARARARPVTLTARPRSRRLDGSSGDPATT